MGLIVKLGTTILDVSDEPYAIVDSRPSILNIMSRKYQTVKGLKFPKSSAVNKKVFGYPDTGFSDLSTVKSVFEVDLTVETVLFQKGTLKIIGNDDKYYIGVFTSRDAQIKALEGFDLDGAIALHNFDNATYNALPNGQARMNYITGNTDPAWVLGFVGATFHPYNNGGGVTNIIPYGALNGIAQDLHYNLAIALSEVFAFIGISCNVFESGSEVTFTSSNLYNNVLINLFTPSWTWYIPQSSTTGDIGPPAENNFRETYSAVAGLGFSKDVISKNDISKMAGKNIWELLVDLSKYLGFFIDVRINDILLIPYTEIGYDSVDLSNKLVQVTNKEYSTKGYEKNNYLRYIVTDTTKKEFGELAFTQNVDYLKEEQTIKGPDNIIPGVYDFEVVQGFFKINWDSKYSSNIIIVYLDSGDTVSGWAEQQQGSINRGVGNNYSTTFYKLKFYSPASEFAIIQTVLDEGVTITGQFNLSINDLNRIKPYTTVVINQLGGEFIVEPFEWVKDKPTKLTLLKIR